MIISFHLFAFIGLPLVQNSQDIETCRKEENVLCAPLAVVKDTFIIHKQYLIIIEPTISELLCFK